MAERVGIEVGEDDESSLLVPELGVPEDDGGTSFVRSAKSLEFELVAFSNDPISENVVKETEENNDAHPIATATPIAVARNDLVGAIIIVVVNCYLPSISLSSVSRLMFL